MTDRKGGTEKNEELRLKCEKVIRKSGAKVTKSRVTVMQCLAQSPTSLSPREILEAIGKDKACKDVDQVSIYRILEMFQKLGLVHQVYPSGGFVACTHIDCQKELHILIRCELCRKTNEVHIPREIFSPAQWFLKEKHGFIHPNNLFQLDGVCSTCSSNENK